MTRPRSSIMGDDGRDRSRPGRSSPRPRKNGRKPTSRDASDDHHDPDRPAPTAQGAIPPPPRERRWHAAAPYQPHAPDRGPAPLAGVRGRRSSPGISASPTAAPSRPSRASRSTIARKAVTAIIGPSGCGKSTFLRSINRMHDLIPTHRYEGDLLLGGSRSSPPDTDLVTLRQRVGMVFQRPNPFPKSIYDNVAYGPALNRLVSAGTSRTWWSAACGRPPCGTR